MKLINRIISHRFFVPVLLLAALFLRVYRLGALTGFYFDQGRDAKIIWDLWHSGKFFLIGPTTGIEGIFLRPFYYYLIAPFYLIGNGNPVIVSIALAVINVLGIYVIYKIGKEFFSQSAGLLASTFVAFSLPLVQAHRWLSNPTPLPLFSATSVWMLLKIITGSTSPWVWSVLGLCLGLGLQLEAASAVFFLPATLLVFLIFRKNINWSLNLLHLIFTFSLTLIPQLWFNFRHDNILFAAFARFLLAEKSFTPVLSDFYRQRLFFYFDTFSQKFFLDRNLAIPFGVILLVAFLLTFRKFKKVFWGLTIIWVTPLVFLLFYHGNYGFVWDYYFTGIYSIFALFAAVVLTAAAGQNKLFRNVVGAVVVVFLVTNVFHLRNYLSAGTDGPTTVVLEPSLAAVDAVYSDAGDKPFNVDVYVPPVIPHAYDYLFLWRGHTKYQKQPNSDLQPLLYLVYEVDPPHPERLEAWLTRQNTYARMISQFRFGGLTVEKRLRF